jgi:hypothetical protein
MNHHTLFLFVFTAITTSAYGQWVLMTSARNCSTAPYTVVGMNMNCIYTDGIYQKIECDGSFVTYADCYSSDCKSNCKTTFTQTLNQCNDGITIQCYPNAKPDYQKYLGDNYVVNHHYSDKKCEGDVISETAHSQQYCRGPASDFAFIYTCNNNTIEEHTYKTIGCWDTPVVELQEPVGQCSRYSHLWTCA